MVDGSISRLNCPVESGALMRKGIMPEYDVKGVLK